MSAPHLEERELIEQAAAHWTARLESGGLTESDRQELARWLEADPEHERVLARYRELCAQLSGQVPVMMDAAEVDAVVTRYAVHRRWRRWGAAALAAAALLSVGSLAWWNLPQQVTTGSAERRTLTLQDGSRVELNARTELAVSLRGRERHVTLARGEALFQVAHDAARPFFVHTPQGVVRVTGTVFDVRETAAAQIEVSVLEGAVQVRPGHADAALPRLLAAGDQAQMDAEHVRLRQLTADELQNVTAWRVGQAAFESLPLGEALERFAPYHSRRISVAPAAATLRVGGRFNLDDLDGFLSAIEQALPVAVLHGAGGDVRVVARLREGR